MPALSAAIIALVGAVLIGLGYLSSSATDSARERIVRFGSLVLVLGLISWAVAFASAKEWITPRDTFPSQPALKPNDL